MHTKILGAVGGALVLAAAVAGGASAHHSFGAEFDQNRPVTLEGEVIMFEWVNPHSWIHVNVKNAETGEDEHWRVEGGAPSALLRRGWNRNSLPPGTEITVTGFQARDGGLRMSASDISFPDGRELSLGNPGASTAAAALEAATEDE